MLRSSLIVTFLTLCASLLGFVVQLLLAQRFGVGVEVDAYLFSLSLPMFLAGLISAILSFNLTPRLVSVKNDVHFHRNLISTLVIGVSIIALALMILMGAGMTLLSQYLLPTESPIRYYSELQKLIIISCAVGGSQIVQGCVSAILISERKYIHSALIALTPYVGMLALLLVMDPSAGIMSVVIGMLLGTLTGVIIGVALLRALIFPLLWKGANWGELLKLVSSSFYTTLAMSCFSAYAAVDAFWGPWAGDGVLATLGYAQRLVIAVGNLAVAGPSAILVPHLVEYLRDGNYRGFMNLMRRTFLLVGAISLMVAVFIGLFAADIVSLLFGYGEFDQEHVIQVADTITNMAPGMVAMLLSVIGFRVLFCFESVHKQIALLGLGWTFGYFVASSLAHEKGAAGIALGYSAIWILVFCMTAILIYKKTRTFNVSDTH
jgi:putative peptidoglycan lipid II flippase